MCTLVPVAKILKLQIEKKKKKERGSEGVSERGNTYNSIIQVNFSVCILLNLCSMHNMQTLLFHTDVG